MQDRETALKNALRELTAIVRGECPSLLNEDSGGNGELSYEIDTLLASPLSAPPQEPPEPPPMGNMDAAKWAQSFVAYVHWKPSIATDEGTMIGWFANAIMAGYDEAMRRVNTSQEPTCACGKPAACRGSYDGAPESFACDDCCGHGGEDGKCFPVEPTGASPQADEWRDIATAPKDGRFIRIKVNGESQPVRGFWFSMPDGTHGAWTRDGYGGRIVGAKSWAADVIGASPQADVACEHGTAMDVHCCNCHSGFIFDVNHECPSPELTWREAVEQALGVENDPENHTPSWAFDVVRAAREIGNAPTPASPQAETCEHMGDGWYVTVGRWGEALVTIEQRCLSGKADLTDDDAALIRGAAKHLQAFIGQPAPVSPVEPTGASPQSDMTQCDYCLTWRSRPCGEGCCWQSASLFPVEPTPEPETCEWRAIGVDECAPQCGHADEEIFSRYVVEKWNACPYCTRLLRLVPSEETPR